MAGMYMALTSKRMKDCARNIVRSCNPKKGDGVIVKGGAHAQELLEDIALECFKEGATPSIIVTSDRFLKRVYSEIPSTSLSTVPKQYLGMVKAADILISIEEIEDPRIAERFPRDKLQARSKASVPIMDVIFDSKKGKKWLYAGWPTRAAARYYGLSYDEFERTIIGGIATPRKSLMKLGRSLDQKLRNAAWVHVWDDKGTDFRVKVEGRRRNIDDGFISDEDEKVGDKGNNLPAGELFIAPHENSGSGTLFCPITSDRVSNKMVTDVHLEFRNGKILLDKTTAGKNASALRSSFRECAKVDRAQYSPIRTGNVAELGIGFNPNVKRAFGYILTDEKVTGTVHLAFGSNKSYGGTSESTMHWDFVSAPGVSIEVERTDGRILKMMERGKLL